MDDIKLLGILAGHHVLLFNAKIVYINEKRIKMISLVNGKYENENYRWYPTPINKIRDILIVGDYSDKSNIAYSIQYLQYLNKQRFDLHLSEVLEKMVIKNFIVTGMGVIELVLYGILKNHNELSWSEWEIREEYTSNIKNANGVSSKIKSTIYEKVDKYETHMKLSDLIAKVKSLKLLDFEKDEYKSLNDLRELRNKVHLRVREGQFKHDYNSFDHNEFDLICTLLDKILRSSSVIKCTDTSELDKILGFLLYSKTEK